MIYLSGVIRQELIGTRPDVGFLLTARMGNIVDLSDTPWGCDSDCFAAGGRFVLDDYLAFLERQRAYRATCLFAVAPDVLSDAAATLARSAPVLPIIRQLGYRAALVAQDGLELLDIDWGSFDVLFIGGSTTWKLSHHAREIVDEAKRRGKWVHMGRVNSERRMRTAKMWGCGSADGTFLKVAPDQNLPRMLRWLDAMLVSPNLVYGSHA